MTDEACLGAIMEAPESEGEGEDQEEATSRSPASYTAAAPSSAGRGSRGAPSGAGRLPRLASFPR